MSAKRIVLILGGARSGKSSYAQELAKQTGGRVLFCATAEALDGEMQSRIEKHRRSRPPGWDTVEASRDIGKVLGQRATEYDAIIIDCITVLVANVMGDGSDAEKAESSISAEILGLIELIKRKQSNYILVSNEVGSGLVPDNKLGRVYRDELGKANQLLADVADEVYLMTAGIPLKLK
ncbi:MAG: bifunctional adenosylcobinamide kinase/adenosylcobinamide-phosphate guanylyltransferase [Chloroflexi bacterium]|nr:bifunctional adenosylcobinamide kinase/adenosylcobinamide-phosphate guanylyltransferase [Chloroflexota bacterium]